MTKQESTAVVRTSTTSSQFAPVEQRQLATLASEAGAQINQTTVKTRLQGNAISGRTLRTLERAEIPPKVLRDLWITKFGVGWVDAADVSDDYEPVKQQLWYAGMLEKLYRPDIGRETWRVFDANT